MGRYLQTKQWQAPKLETLMQMASEKEKQEKQEESIDEVDTPALLSKLIQLSLDDEQRKETNV